MFRCSDKKVSLFVNFPCKILEERKHISCAGGIYGTYASPLLSWEFNVFFLLQFKVQADGRMAFVPHLMFHANAAVSKWAK